MSLEDIFDVKTPKQDNQQILLMGYYLNKIERRREFRSKDIERLYSQLKIDVPKNITYHLRKMSEKDKELLVQGSKQGRFKIADKGIDFIHENIPSK